MPQIVILPHPVFCPEGAVLEGQSGKSICDTLLDNHIEIEHACDRVCACTTCHVVVREGFDSLNEQEEKEEDMLDKAWGLEPNSRLSAASSSSSGSAERECSVPVGGEAGRSTSAPTSGSRNGMLRCTGPGGHPMDAFVSSTASSCHPSSSMPSPGTGASIDART